MAKRTQDDLVDMQGMLDDAIKVTKALLSDLDCAETCETLDDFYANLDNALENVATIRAELKSIR